MTASITMLPGPVSKRNHFVSSRPRRNSCEVRDTADVLHDAAYPRIAIQQVVQKGNQRRALAACCHVGGTKIRYDRYAHAGCNHGCFARLPGDGDALAEIGLGSP